MSTESILNALVAAIAINSIAGARFTLSAQHAKALQHGRKYVATTTIAALTSLVLWISLGISTGHWQFIAIVAVPTLITVGSLATTPTTSAGGGES